MKKISKYLSLILISFLVLITHVNADTQLDLQFGYGEHDHTFYSSVSYQTDASKFYLYNEKYLYSYDFVNEKLELFYTFDFSINETYMQGDIIYVSSKNSSNVKIVGINVKTKEKVLEQTFAQKMGIGSNFVVDSKQNVYLSDSDNIYIYDKTGSLIDSYVDIGNGNVSLQRLDPDESILFATISYYNEGFFQVKDGKFVKKELTHYSRQRILAWNFFDNNKAINNYGEIAHFNEAKDNYSLKFQGIATDIGLMPTAFIDGDNLYISYPENEIYVLDKNTYEKKGTYKLDGDKILYKFYVKNNKLYMIYKLNNFFYSATYDLSVIEMSKNIDITTHTTLNYRKEDVISRYLNSLAKFNYDDEIFSSLPHTTAPYYEGILQPGVVSDVLNQYNFYRYLSGLNEVNINNDKMPRSQKGALILSVNNVLTHTPSQPKDMEYDFYEEAYDGVYAKFAPGDTYSGNISGGTAVYNLVRGFVDDSSNVMPNVGHRSSMLDPFAKSISFGFMPYKYTQNATYSYGAISVYYDDENTNEDSYFPWPPAGYIPTESFPAKENTMWSIWLDSKYRATSNTKITITFRGVPYIVNSNAIYKEDNTIYYYVPSALNKIIRTQFNEYITDEPISFKITGLEEDVDKVSISYDTTFVRGKVINLNSFKFFTSTNGYTYSSVSEYGTVPFKLNQEYMYMIDREPKNATVDMEIKALDSSIIKIDSTNQTFTPIKGGDTTITITDKLSGISKTYKIHIDSPSTGVKLNKTEITLMPGETFNLEASLIPEGSTDPTNFTGSTTNEGVASVKNGFVTAGDEGRATITVKTSKGYTAECQVLVASYLKGDLNENGTIQVADALEALYFAIGEREVTERKIAIGDFNADRSITVYDALEILKIFVKQ